MAVGCWALRLPPVPKWVRRPVPKWLRRKSEASTRDWEYFAERPMRRGVSLTRALCGVIVGRARAEWVEPRSQEKAESIRAYAATKLTDRIIGLGPTYVKLGQIASCRRELEGTAWAKALARLQDDVPPFDTRVAQAVVEEEMGGEFLEFGEPIAAASLGQVHRATLKDGRQVAVKVQRPGLRQIYDRDARTLRKVAKICDRFVESASEICDDSVEILYREIDYLKEAENARRFAEDLKPYPWVKTPEVYNATEKVLVMEYVPGISLKNLGALEAQGFDKRGLAEKLARIYLLQFCKFGFFNTDPHAGNLAADDKVKGGRLIVYDFGQATALSDEQSRGILGVIEAIIDMNAAACVDAFDEMGVLKPDFDKSKIVDVVANNFRTGKVKTRARSFKTDDANLNTTTNATQADIMAYFQLPATYAFVARALSQLTGVAVALDPDFDFIAASAPLLYDVKGLGAYLRDELAKRCREFNDFFNPSPSSSSPRRDAFSFTAAPAR